MSRIPEETIDRIRESNDIVDTVGEYVQLRQRGKNYFGLCPFHQEKTASFSVAPDKQIYHCFGCGKGGNVISFIMEYEKLNFIEAINRLAERAGISLPKSEAMTDDTTPSLGPLYEANAFAMRLFEKALHSEQGEDGLRYLQDRGFSEASLGAFHVGYAPDSWDTMTEWGPKNGHSLDTLEKAGLVIRRKERSGYYDRFRHRVMFPILNHTGRPVGFGGRALDPEDKAKYMNSPESPVYHKRKILYGLHQAKEHIRKEKTVVIVEGYTDLLRMWDHEIRNVIAVSGTAFTGQHAQILDRFVERTWLCYDSDSAGIQATMRAGKLLVQAGIEVRCIELPEGHDPDSILREEGTKEFNRLVDEAVSLMRFRLDRLAGDLSDGSARARFIHEALDDVAEIDDNLVRDLQLQDLADMLRLDVARLQSELQKQLSGRRRFSRPGPAGSKQSTHLELEGVEKSQYELVKLLLTEDPPLITYILEHVSGEDFTHPVLGGLARVFIGLLEHRDIIAQENALNVVMNSDDISGEHLRAAQQLVSRMLFELEESKESLRKERMAKDCLLRMELATLQHQIEEINQSLHGRKTGDKEALSLLKKRQSLEQFKQEIREKYS